MRRKSLNKISLQRGGGTPKKTVSRNTEKKPSNPDYADLVPSIKSAIEMGASVKELLFELIQQNVPDEDIKGALIESGIEESAVEEAEFEIQQDAMRQMQQQMQAAAAQKQEQQNPQQEQDPNLEQAADGTETKDPPPDSIIDLLADYNIDPDSKEGYELAKKLTLEAIESGNSVPQFSCRGGGCAAIASNAAREFGVFNNRANAWDLGNKNYPQWISSNYAEDLKKKQLAQRWLAGNKDADINSERYKEFLETANKPLNHIPGWRYNLGEFQENVKAGNLVGLDRSNSQSSIAYANNQTYPKNRGYEHSGFMMDDNYMIHGSKHDHGPNSPYKGVYTIDDIQDGIALPGYGEYSPVETIGVDKVDDIWNTVQENDYMNKLVDFFKSIEMPDTDFSLMPFAYGDEVKDLPENPPTNNPEGFLSKADYNAKMLAEATAKNQELKSAYDSELSNYNNYLTEKEKYDASNSGYAASLDAYNYQQANPNMFPTRFGGIGWRSGLDKSFQDPSRYRKIDEKELAEFNSKKEKFVNQNNARLKGLTGEDADSPQEQFIPAKSTYVPVDWKGSAYDAQHLGSIYENLQKPVSPGAAPTEVIKPTEPSYVDTTQYMDTEITPLPVMSAGTLSGTPTQGIIGEYEEDEIEAPTYNSWEGSRPQKFMGAKNPFRGGRRLSAGLTQKLSGYDSDAMNAEIDAAESEGRRINFEGLGKGSASSGKFQKQYNKEYDEYEAAIKEREDQNALSKAMTQGMLNRFTGTNDNLVKNQDGDEIIPGAVSDNTSVVNPYPHYGSSEPFKKLSKSDFYSNIIKRMTENSDNNVDNNVDTSTDMYNSQGVTMQSIGMQKGGEPPSKAYLKNISKILNKEGVHPYMLVVGDKELGIPKMVSSPAALTSILGKIPNSYYEDENFMNVVGDTFALLNNGDQYQNIKDEYYSLYGNDREQAEATKKLEDQAYNNLGTTKKAEEAKEAKRIAAEEVQWAKDDAQYEKQRQIDIANKKRQAEIDNMNFLQLATGAAGELYDEYVEQPLRSGINSIADAPVDGLKWVDNEILKPVVDYAWENAINPAIDYTVGHGLPIAIDAAQDVNNLYRRIDNTLKGQSYSSEDAPFYNFLFDNSAGTSYNSSFDDAFNSAYDAGVEEFNWNGKRYNTAKEGESRKGNPRSAETQKALDIMGKYLDENFESTTVNGITLKPSERLFHMHAEGNSPFISGDPAKIFSMFNVADDSKNTKTDTNLSELIEGSDEKSKLLASYFKPGFKVDDQSTWIPKDKYSISKDEVQHTDDKKKAYKSRSIYKDEKGNFHLSSSGRPSYDPTSNTMHLDKDLLNNPEQLLSAYIAEMSHVAQQKKIGAGEMMKDFVSKDGSFYDSDAFGQMRKNLKKINTGFGPLDEILQPAANQILKNTVQNDIYGGNKTVDQVIKGYRSGDPYYAEHAHKFYEDGAFNYLLGNKNEDGSLIQGLYDPKVGYEASGHFEGDGHDHKFGGESLKKLSMGAGIPGNISNLPGGTYGARYRNPMTSYLPMDLGMKGSGANFLANAIQAVPNLFSNKDRDGDGAMDGLLRDRKLKRNRKRDQKGFEYDYYLEDQMGNRPNQSLSGYSSQDLYEAIRRGSGMDGVRSAEEMESDLGKFSKVDFNPKTGDYEMIMSDRDPLERLSKNKKIREAFMEKYEGMDSNMGDFLQRFKDNPESKEKFLEMYKARKDGSTFGFSPGMEAFTYGKDEQNPYYYNTMMGYNQYHPDAISDEAVQKLVFDNFISPQLDTKEMDPGYGVLRFPNTPFTFRDGGGLPKAQPGMEWLAGQIADQAAYEQNQMAKQQFEVDMGQYIGSFNNSMGLPDGSVEFPTAPGDVDPSDLQMMFAVNQAEQSAMSNMQEGKAAMIRDNQPESDFELKKKRKKGLFKEKLNKAKDKFGNISNKVVGVASDINSMFRDQRGRYAANQAMLEGTSVDAQGMQFQGELARGRRDLNTGIEYDVLMGNSPSGYDDGSQFSKRGGEVLDLSPAMIAKLISAGADIEMK